MYKFGRLPGKIPVGLHELSYYTAGSLPQAPPQVEVPVIAEQPDGTPWGILGNDTYGNCGVAGLTHGFMADAEITTEKEVFPGNQQVIEYYLNYTGGQDTGVVLSDYLTYVRDHEFYGHTVSAYAPVGVHDIPSLHFSIWAFGFAYTGITVTKAMMDAFGKGKPWDLDDLLTEPVGGHCVPLIGFDSSQLYCVTWGKVQPISYAAWHYMSSEAWAVITGEFLASDGDGRGVNLIALQADLSKLT